MGFGLADHLAKIFGTSLLATVLRMMDETDEAAITVQTDGNNVCWSKRNSRKLPEFDFHVEKGRVISDETLAWNAVLDGDASGKVDPKTWFPQLTQSHCYEVFEEVRYLEVYGLTLSLLMMDEG